ncbi:MAG: lysoplasmalogenase [Flavobacteriales bacterium]|nr:lysoplasmalogenase [Flavobacteriales bacterium]
MSDINRLQKFFLLIFLLVSITDIIAIINDNSLWQTISKPLIIPALAAFYVAGSKSRNKLYILALIFSFLGDVLLLDKSNLFLFGIAAFLITQLLYIAIFSKGLANSSLGKKIGALFPFSLFFILLIRILKPGLNDFLIPVIIYGLAISLFGSVSLLRYLVKKNGTSMVLLIGAILFILSDSMIALNKFHEPRAYYSVSIMLTYILAQYLISAYMLKSEKNRRLHDGT